MEHGDGGLGKRPLTGGFTVKKQLKSPLQVQILEEAYSVEPNPTTRMKERLARRTGLEYMKIQNWFGNRRYLDKHGPRRFGPSKDHGHPPVGGKPNQVAPGFNPGMFSSMSSVSVARAAPLLMTGSVRAAESWDLLKPEPRAFMPAGTSMAQPRTGPELPLPPPMAQSHLLPMRQKLQQVTRVEEKPGHPLRTDGLIFGTKFKPSTSGTLGDPLVNMEQTRFLQPCNGKEIDRAWLESVKASTFLDRLKCGSVTSPFNETDVTVRDVHMLDVEAPRDVHEYQFFPMEPSWSQKYENVNQTRFPVPSVNTSNCGGQTSNKNAYIASSFPFQCEKSKATYQSQQGDAKITSSLAEYHKAPNIFLPNCAPDDDYSVIPITQLGNPFNSSDKAILCDDNSCRIKNTQIHRSRSSVVNEFQQSDHARISTAAAFEDINNKKRSRILQNKRKRDQSCGLHHGHGYDRYLVMPREQYETASVDDARQINYFRHVDDCYRLIVAKWNQKESQAVYIVDDSDNTLSMSSGTDSTLSIGYDDEVTGNVKGYAEVKSTEVTNVAEATAKAKGYVEGKFIEVINVDDGDHAGEDRNGQEDINVIGNGEDDVEIENMDYKDGKKEDTDKEGEINEYKWASPVSSEQTV